MVSKTTPGIVDYTCCERCYFCRLNCFRECKIIFVCYIFYQRWYYKVISKHFSRKKISHTLSVPWCLMSWQLKVLLQWNSTSVYTSWTYSTYHLELALGTFIRQFISACLVCHTSQEKYIWIRIRKFMVPDIRCVPISHLWRPLCRGCKQIAHVLGNDCDIVFISLKSTENVQRVTLSCSYCFTDTVTEVLVPVKW